MAITLTAVQLAAALRLGDSPEELAEVTRLLAYATTTVERHLASAFSTTPDAVVDESVRRLAGYLYDQPEAGRGDAYANSLRNSGAASILLPWRLHGAGLENGVAEAQAAIGSPGNPVTNVVFTGGILTVSFADGTTTTFSIMDGGNGGEGGDGVDQTARDAAAAAAEDVETHNAATDSHEDIRTALAGRVDQDAVEQTAQRLIDSAGHATNVALGVTRDALVAHAGMPHSISEAYDWATVGNDTLLVPTDKINFSSVQNQLDDIVDQIAHSAGTITAVVPTVGSGQDSLRYALPNNLNGQYDVSVRVKARVQVNEFANISGNLHIIEDGGNGLNAAIPERTHNYHHAHDGVVNFVRRGLTIGPGVNQIDFRALVTGPNPPDVRFVELENLTLTDTSLVNAGNVNPFIADWAEDGNADPVPDAKLTEIRSWARASAHANDYPFAQQLGGFNPFAVAEIANGEEQKFFYHAIVQRDPDGTLAYIGGSWAKEILGGGAPAAFEDPLILETDLTTDYLTVLTIPSQSLTAGKKYRVTSTTFARAIGDAHHTLYARLFLGADIVVTAQTAIDPEGSSQGRWAMTIDRIVTMPTPAVSISMAYSETTASFVRVLVPTTMIAMEVS